MKKVDNINIDCLSCKFNTDPKGSNIRICEYCSRHYYDQFQSDDENYKNISKSTSI